MPAQPPELIHTGSPAMGFVNEEAAKSLMQFLFMRPGPDQNHWITLAPDAFWTTKRPDRDPST